MPNTGAMIGVFGASCSIPSLLAASATNQFPCLSTAEYSHCSFDSSFEQATVFCQRDATTSPTFIYPVAPAEFCSSHVTASGIALGVGIPALLEKMSDLYLMAVSQRLSFQLKENVEATLAGIRTDYAGLQYYQRQYQGSEYEEALKWIGEALGRYELRQMRRVSAIPSLLQRAADAVYAFAPEKMEQMKARLLLSNR